MRLHKFGEKILAADILCLKNWEREKVEEMCDDESGNVGVGAECEGDLKIIDHGMKVADDLRPH